MPGLVPFNYGTFLVKEKAFVNCSIIAIPPFKSQSAYAVHNNAHIRI
jgi:hypothetical protein